MKKTLILAAAAVFCAASVSFCAVEKPLLPKKPIAVPVKPIKTKVKITKDDWKQIKVTVEQLKKFDGKNGNPAYVAVDGVVYDVTAIPAWKNGEHKRGLKAGNDLTADFAAAPPFHRANHVLNKAIKIGVLIP
jgi:predicted heme/steroid binding protein